jgi:hypothetical protein
MARSQGSEGVRYRLQYRHTVRTCISTSVTIGPSLAGLRGTQLTGSIIYTLVSWRCRLLNHAAKLELVRSVLASIPLYLVSVIKFPKWAITLINSQMAHCLWDNYECHYRYHLANWGLVSQKKEYGGLGIPNLAEMNMCLLASWVKRYHIDDINYGSR